MVLASDSRRTRSNSPAKMRPKHHAAAGADDQPDDVVAQDLGELGLGHDREVRERELARDRRWKLRMIVPAAG